MFHLVSLSLQISLTFAWLSPWPVCVFGCWLLVFFFVVCFQLLGWLQEKKIGENWFLSLGKFVFNHKLTPVVDRPSLALVRQCRKKKNSLTWFSLAPEPLVRVPFSTTRVFETLFSLN